VTLLATFKHISSKNADYGAAEQYLTFEHDEFTMKPTLDEAGRLVPRENYRIATLNCGEKDFAVACMRSNLRYGKNQKREDVKSHHYIISFDPRDGPDNGLTVDWAQALGEEFCAEHFSGHQAIVCTHPDGHNHSGNIHVHIVINSLRIEEVPLLPYMDRPADTRAGCKHRCTDAAMEYFKAEIMEMCHRENLYQIDLLHGSKNRVTEREYWAQKKGQLALDKENAAALAAGQPVTLTGKLTENYIRYRADSTEGNNQRMQRQKQVVLALVHKMLAQVKEDPASILALYNNIRRNTTTNINTAMMVYLAQQASGMHFSDDIVNVPGTSVMGEQRHAEYQVDSDALLELILSIFYEPVEG